MELCLWQMLLLSKRGYITVDINAAAGTKRKAIGLTPTGLICRREKPKFVSLSGRSENALFFQFPVQVVNHLFLPLNEYLDKAECTPIASLPMAWEAMCSFQDAALGYCAIGGLFGIILR